MCLPGQSPFSVGDSARLRLGEISKRAWCPGRLNQTSGPPQVRCLHPANKLTTRGNLKSGKERHILRSQKNLLRQALVILAFTGNCRIEENFSRPLRPYSHLSRDQEKRLSGRGQLRIIGDAEGEQHAWSAGRILQSNGTGRYRSEASPESYGWEQVGPVRRRV